MPLTIKTMPSPRDLQQLIQSIKALPCSFPEFASYPLWHSPTYNPLQNTSREPIEYFNRACSMFDFKTAELLSKSLQIQDLVALRDSIPSNLEKREISLEIKSHLILASIARHERDYNSMAEHYQSVFYLKQGPLISDALRVEQRELGISDKKKLGTDNIKQCVVLILNNPITKKTILLHVDQVTSEESIVRAISTFADSESLEARLIGANDSYGGDWYGNLDKVLNVLLKNNRSIDIQSADILDKTPPMAIVFNPDTAELVHGVPGEFHSSTAARQFRAGKLANEKDLRLAFEFINGNSTIYDFIFTTRQLKELEWDLQVAERTEYLSSLISSDRSDIYISLKLYNERAAKASLDKQDTITTTDDLTFSKTDCVEELGKSFDETNIEQGT